MKKYTRFLCLAGLMLLCLCLALSACDSGEPKETTPAPLGTDVPTEAMTDTPAEPESLPESDIDPETEAATEATTEQETAAPSLMLTVDLDGAAQLDISDYVSRTTKCSVTLVADEAEGTVLRMATEGISGVGTAKPIAFLRMGELVKAMNGILPNTTEYPHLVMKVKAHELWSRSFSYFGGSSLREAGNYEGSARLTRVGDSEDWQYIYLDLTSFTEDWSYFYLNFEQGAGKDGEALDIAEIRFFATAEEAAALCPAVSNTYPVVEQTMEDYTLKVMSFNIQTENGTQVDFALRAELFRDLLDELQPDSIGMQEVTVSWIKWMDSFAFNDSYAGVGEGRTTGGEASSIYYRKDKYELIDSGTFWLSDTPDVQGSALENANYPRICTWAQLKDKATGFEYIHLNTHLDHNGNNSSSDGRAIRTAQVRVILEFIQTLPDLPLVMTGDFNQGKTNSSDELYAMFKNILGQSTFKSSTGEKITGCFSDARADAKETVSPDAWASMTSYWQEGGSKYDPAHKPIDYVFYTAEDFDAMVYRNIHYHRDGIYMSDHLPQYCELHVKAAADGE